MEYKLVSHELHIKHNSEGRDSYGKQNPGVHTLLWKNARIEKLKKSWSTTPLEKSKC